MAVEKKTLKPKQSGTKFYTNKTLHNRDTQKDNTNDK